jgi:hypothetical protein
MQDLTVWAEERAGLEFSRRESVRAAAKGVEDVLRLSGARWGNILVAAEIIALEWGRAGI